MNCTAGFYPLTLLNNLLLLFSYYRLQYAYISSLGSHGNLFTGSIPLELCALTDLIGIDFTSNLLTGTIPECIGISLANLEFFLVASNSLEGTIPKSFQNLTLLGILDVSDNNFNGTFPGDWIGNLTFLNHLDFSENNFVGTLASSLSSLTNLEFIAGSYNNFTGPLPEFGKASSKLQELLFSNNQLTGTVPVSFSNLTALSKCDFIECRKPRENSSGSHTVSNSQHPLSFFFLSLSQSSLYRLQSTRICKATN
jgi:hypothetical protein